MEVFVVVFLRVETDKMRNFRYNEGDYEAEELGMLG
jgi:hypothetical protein